MTLRSVMFVACIAGAVGLALPWPVLRAQESASRQADFAAYLQVLSAHARAAGIREATIQSVIPTLTYNPTVIALDHAQPGGPTNAPPPDFAPYRRAHVDASRVARGQAMYRALGAQGDAIAARYGVPLPVVLAIWGAETDFGGQKGNFDLARSLATLAYDGRRRDLFEGEFIALLRMIDLGVPRYKLVGSWAGAFGNPQFLPSAWLRVAQDGDGDGVRDIWDSRADTVASIANYFREAGWRAGQPWGVGASVPVGLDRSSFATRLISPRCPRVFARHSRWQTVGEWRSVGVYPRGPIGDNVQAVLFEPDGPGTPAYLLTSNYRVILDYNCSNFYALSVGLLSDEIAR